MAESIHHVEEEEDKDEPVDSISANLDPGKPSIRLATCAIKGSGTDNHGNSENSNFLTTLDAAVEEPRTELVETTPKEENNKAASKGEAEYSEADYMLIDNGDELKTGLLLIEEAVQEEPEIAIDCEGENLSRKGKLLLISVATRKKAFLFDVLALQSEPFDRGLRAILEDKKVRKFMFDCRGDSDALFHQYKVKLDGVLDIQLLEVIKRPTEAQKDLSKRRSERHSEVVRLRGQLWCIENLLNDKDMLTQKKKGASFMRDWGKRPLVTEQLEYAKTDVLSLFKLFDKLHPSGEDMRRLEIASAVYVDLKRSIVVRNYDEYEDHGYLPMDVIPDPGRTGFDYGYIACVGCKRVFPGDEFSKTQLKNSTQKCRTCKSVKLDIDRRKNMEKQSEFDYGYDYDSSSSSNYYDHDKYDDSDDNYFGYDSDW